MKLFITSKVYDTEKQTIAEIEKQYRKIWMLMLVRIKLNLNYII